MTASGKEGVTLAWEIGPLVRLTGAISRDFAVRGGLGLEGGTEESGEGKSRTEESGTEEDGEGGSGTKKSGTKESGEGESGTEESGERESGTEGSEGGESGTKESGKGESGTEGSGEGESDRNESSAKGAEEYGVNPGVASTDVGVTVAATAEREESGPQEGDQGMLSWRLEDGSRQGGDCQKSDVPLRPGMQDGGITGDGGIRNEIVLGEAKNREGGVLGEYRERSCGQLPPNQASGSEANGVVAVRVESSKGSLSDDEIAGGGEWGWRALGAEDTGAASEAGGAESASGGEGAENASAGGGAASASRQEFIEAASGGSFAETTFGRKVAKRASEERGVEAASRKGVAETAFGGGGGQSALGGGLAETPSGGGVAETASKRGVAETASVVGGGQTALGGGAKTRAAGLVGALKLDGRAVAVSFHQQDWETESAIEEVPLAPWHSPPRESEQLVSASVANEQVGCEQAGGQDNGSDLPPRTFRKRKLRPLEKSPLAGTGRFVGLGTRKELETLMKVLGGPSRGTRGMSTGLGGRASMREVRQNTPTEERSGYDPRSSFREAWAAEAERNRPFWAKLFPRAGSFARYERSGALHRPAGEANGGPPVGRFGWLTDEECHPADTSCAGMYVANLLLQDTVQKIVLRLLEHVFRRF